MNRTELTARIIVHIQKKKHVTAKELAQEYEVSVRTIYRIVNELSLVIPIYYERGRYGGIRLLETRR